MSNLEVRPVQSSDAAELADLLNELIAIGGTTALEDPFTPERLDQTYLTGPDVYCCNVAVDKDTGRLEGFQTVAREGDLEEGWGDIGTFARADGRQRGVGSALFTATRKDAADAGLTMLLASIRADNSGGLIFYEKIGFRDHAVKSGFRLKDGTPVDKVKKIYQLRPVGEQSETATDSSAAPEAYA